MRKKYEKAIKSLAAGGSSKRRHKEKAILTLFDGLLQLKDVAAHVQQHQKHWQNMREEILRFQRRKEISYDWTPLVRVFSELAKIPAVREKLGDSLLKVQTNNRQLAHRFKVTYHEVLESYLILAKNFQRFFQILG